MQVLKRILLALTVMGALLGVQAFAATQVLKIACSDQVGGPLAASRLQNILQKLDGLQLNTLLQATRDSRVDVIFSAPSALSPGSVSWKVGWFGRKKLVVRELPWSTLSEQEASTWKVAVALYQLQLERRWVFFRSVNVSDLDADMTKLANSLHTQFAPGLERGHIERALRKVQRFVIYTMAGLAMNVAADAFIPASLMFEAPPAAITENVDDLLYAEKARLERTLEALKTNPAADQELVEELKVELKNFCTSFKRVCPAQPGQ